MYGYRARIGYTSPPLTTEVFPYEFYKIVPDGVTLVITSLAMVVRSKEEVDRMRTEHDPITHLRQRLIEDHRADEDALKQIEKRARDVVVEAAQFAQDCPEPDPSELWTDVLAEA